MIKKQIITKQMRVICLLSITLVLFCLGGIFGEAFAQDQHGGGGGQQPAVNGSANLVAGYGLNHWQCKDGKDDCTNRNYNLFTQSPSDSSNLLSSLYFNTLFKALAGKLGRDQGNTTAAGVSTLLTATLANQGNIFKNSIAIAAPIDSSKNLYALVTKNNDQGKLISEKIQPDQLASQLGPVNLYALIKPLQYEQATKKRNGNQLSKQQTNALNFIKYVSTQYAPMTVVDFSKLGSPAAVETELKKIGVQQYISAVRQMAARYSIGINNLMFLYHERVATVSLKSLGFKQGDIPKALLPKDSKNKDDKVSPLAIDHWMATRRLISTSATDKKSWRAKIENATPATLQREMVILLAEIRKSLNDNKRVNERILAAVSVNVMENNSSAQLQIASLQRAICIPQSTLLDSGACPPPPSTENITAG